MVPHSFSGMSPTKHSLSLARPFPTSAASFRLRSTAPYLRPRGAGENARSYPSDSASEASGVKSPLKQSGCILRIGIGTKRRLAETHVDRIVEALHPDHHLGSASGARPAVGQAVERLPESSPEPNLEGQRERPSGAIGAPRNGMTGSTCIRLARPLLQRERYFPHS